jgi:hypothetical protein
MTKMPKQGANREAASLLPSLPAAARRAAAYRASIDLSAGYSAR